MPKINNLLFILLLHGQLHLKARAECGLNTDNIKRRRIEAVRGQILSKLGLNQLPVESGSAPSSFQSTNIEEMYNRTRDFLVEQAREQKRECVEQDEDYFAQDIFIINSTSKTKSKQFEPHSKTPQPKQLKDEHVSKFFYFEVDSENLTPDSIATATLRLYQIKNLNARNIGRQQVELYQLFPPKPGRSKTQKRLITTKLMMAEDEGWKSFDITNAVRNWAQSARLNQGLEITASCRNPGRGSTRFSPQGRNSRLDIKFAGSTDKTSPSREEQDTEEFYSMENFIDYQPHIIVSLTTKSAQLSSQANKRRKRSLDADYCFRRNPSEPNCCLRELYIDFKKDLGWNWIYSPTGYQANYCAGACPYLWSMDTQHSAVLHLYKSMNPMASSTPCCAAKEMEPLLIMYYNNGGFVLKQLPRMSLLSCTCG